MRCDPVEGLDQDRRAAVAAVGEHFNGDHVAQLANAVVRRRRNSSNERPVPVLVGVDLAAGCVETKASASRELLVRRADTSIENENRRAAPDVW